MKFLFVFVTSALALAAENPLGKIHTYDAATGKVEIRVNTGAQAPRNIYIDVGVKRLPCSLKTSLHTKVICQAGKSLALQPGMPAYASAGIEKPAVTPASEPAILGSLLGTKWTGTDSENEFYEFIYDKNGVLEYLSPTGRFRNGTWTQEGNVVRMEMNNHYSDYEGTITGDTIAGGAKNVTGKNWTWRVTRQAP